jgi:formylglycine-generating enzyme required for sulfatase activity
MLGNVRQWTLDCGFYGYEGAPDDGSAWISGIPRNMDCKAHVLRGSDIFLQSHTFFLYKTATPIWAFDIGNIYTKNVGFRIVQDL